MPRMTAPHGKLLVIAAVLTGAAFAQAAKPSDVPTTPAVPAPRVVPHRAAPPAVQPKRRTTTTTATRAGTGSGKAATDASAKVLYLTFDDGPHPVWTPKVLSVLAKHHAKATFFVLGSEEKAHPELVVTTRHLGHRIGNHTWDHPMLTRLTTVRIRQEISTGVRSQCFRPPFRDTDARVHAIATSLGQREVLWDVDTSDWSKPGAGKVERAILKGARPGAIILLHDGGGNRSQTVTALDRALTRLAAEGYTFRALPC
jgi:peptidoglycan-N-acetylglucosamine deacetylase